MLRLLRFRARKPPLSAPLRRKPMARRVWSPVPGGSTFTTSAPMSPSSMQQNGPAMTWLTSRTLRCERGRGAVIAAQCRERAGRRSNDKFSRAAEFFSLGPRRSRLLDWRPFRTRPRSMSIVLERADHIATVILDKPDKMNALDLGMWRD